MSKPRILICADVRGWAWGTKARALQRHLSDEFDITVAYINADGVPHDWRGDLVHTFEFPQVEHLPRRWPKVTGITAHVWKTWEGIDKPEKGGKPGTVARWASEEFGVVGVHANSVMLRDEIAALLGRPIYLTENGVDETFFRRTRPHPSGPLVVGWVGKGSNKRKGLDIVREACRLAGVELRAVDRSSHNALSAEEMVEFYQGVHVLAVASTHDGTPGMALEGSACACAVVGNRIGNLPELIVHGSNGLLVDLSAEALAAGLRECAADMGRTLAMGAAARAVIESAWTWRHKAENYRLMWREVLK